MRGTLRGCGFVVLGRRIIPAGAGHFKPQEWDYVFAGDHPRRCGALVIACRAQLAAPGSSPQVRGTLPPTSRDRSRLGIIPAGAGHLYTPPRRGLATRDHPRRCGALSRPTPVLTMIWGSSPQVRGTCLLISRGTSHLGIIPAGAGHLFYSW